MSHSITVSPPNSLIGIVGSPDAQIPASIPDSPPCIAWTASCIMIRCLMEQDGPTAITLAEEPPVEPNGHLIFDGMLDTPHRDVVVVTVEWQKLLDVQVPDARTRVRIWVNHLEEPDEVLIGVDKTIRRVG